MLRFSRWLKVNHILGLWQTPIIYLLSLFDNLAFFKKEVGRNQHEFFSNSLFALNLYTSGYKYKTVKLVFELITP